MSGPAMVGWGLIWGDGCNMVWNVSTLYAPPSLLANTAVSAFCSSMGTFHVSLPQKISRVEERGHMVVFVGY